MNNRASTSNHPRPFSRRLPALLFAMAILCVLSACDKELAQKPPRIGGSPTFETKPSSVGALASIPLAEISRIVNSNIPSSFSAGGNGDDVCVKVGYRIPTPLGDIKDEKNVCAGTKYELSAQRTAAVTIGPVGASALRVSLPASFSGSGGFRGDVASAIKVDKKNFNGALTVDVDLTPILTEDWCPQLNASVTHTWTSDPKVEIVGSVWVNVKSVVEGEINKKLPELVSAVKQAIDCNKFRSEIAAIYGSKTFPVDIPSIGLIHINIQPTDIGFSGIAVEGDLLKAAAIFNVNVDVTTTPLTPRVMPLPKLKTIAPITPQMSISIPVRVSYETLTTAISQAIKGKTFEKQTPAGKIVVKTKSAEIYPSNEKLVVGIEISADLPGSFFDTQGKIFLLARPQIENGTKVTVADASYSQTLDNDFWSVVSVVFEDQIRDAITKAATYDLSVDIADSKALLAKKLNDPTTMGGWKVSLGDVDMKVGRVAIAERELAVEGLFSAFVTVEPKL